MAIRKLVSEWKNDLNPSEVEALEDLYADSDLLSANAVFDSIVTWNGGMATGYGIRSLVSRVYGIELSEVI